MAKKNVNQKVKSEDEGGYVYSTNPNFALAGLAALLGESEVKKDAPMVEVHLEKKHRGGKAAVIIKGFAGTEAELEALGKKLKTAMGVGGSTKDGEIIIQGDNREKVMKLLQQWGYKTKRVGG